MGKRKSSVQNPIKIDILRQEAGYSWHELSVKSGVSQRTLEYWANRKRIPRDVYLLSMVAKVFGCTIEDIIEPLENYDKTTEI